MEEQFPAGLRVLVVDDDPICLLIVERLLRSCLYQVTTCEQAVMALAMLRENKSRFDVVLSDVHMPHMDGFKLLELVRLEMDVPIIMMSANGDTSNVMKGISQGACDYLLKPVRLEELQNIWQHVVRKQHTLVKVSKTGPDAEDRKRERPNVKEPVMTSNVTQDGNIFCTTQRKRTGCLDEDSANEDEDHLCSAKRQRVVWSVELHQKFVCAINHLGLEQAVPKRILDLMNVPGLTRENVASHLQKYRLYVRKMSGPGISTCIGTSDSFMNSLNFWDGFPAFQLNGFSRQNELPLQTGISGSPMTSDSTVNYIDHRAFMNRYKDPDRQAHVGVNDSLIDRSATAWRSNLVLEKSSECFQQQGLRVPVPPCTSWNARQSASELESFGRDYLFIHQLEMAQSIPRDLY